MTTVRTVVTMINGGVAHVMRSLAVAVVVAGVMTIVMIEDPEETSVAMMSVMVPEADLKTAPEETLVTEMIGTGKTLVVVIETLTEVQDETLVVMTVDLAVTLVVMIEMEGETLVETIVMAGETLVDVMIVDHVVTLVMIGGHAVTLAMTVGHAVTLVMTVDHAGTLVMIVDLGVTLATIVDPEEEVLMMIVDPEEEVLMTIVDLAVTSGTTVDHGEAGLTMKVDHGDVEVIEEVIEEVTVIVMVIVVEIVVETPGGEEEVGYHKQNVVLISEIDKDCCYTSCFIHIVDLDYISTGQCNKDVTPVQ